MHGGTAGRALLGVVVSTLILGGVVVQGVTAGGLAASAGIKPGDAIVSVAERSTTTSDVLSSVLATLRPGQTVPVQILSPSGQLSIVEVKLGSQPARLSEARGPD